MITKQKSVDASDEEARRIEDGSYLVSLGDFGRKKQQHGRRDKFRQFDFRRRIVVAADNNLKLSMALLILLGKEIYTWLLGKL